MKKYEGLFILQNTAKEEAIKELIDKLSSEISTAGGKIETVQKMDKRAFARVADKKFSTGYYVNFIFEVEPSAIHALRGRLVQNRMSSECSSPRRRPPCRWRQQIHNRH